MPASPSIRSFIGASFLVVCAGLLADEPKAPATKADPLMAEVTADLKALHTAFEKYLIAHDGIWPQQPQELADGSEGEYLKWWIDHLRPYGAKDTDWYVSEQGKADDYVGDALISYIPTPFDDTPLLAYLWKNQPWLVTRFQAPGSIVLLPEGTVREMPSLEEMAKQNKAEGAVRDAHGNLIEKGRVPISKIPEPLRQLAKDRGWKVTDTGTPP